jgi:unsaturated chondroitin disaccharide hydrolase
VMSRVFVVCVLLLMSRSLGAQGPSGRKVIDINGGSLDLVGSSVSTADSILDRALSRAVAKVKRSATNLDPANGYPRVVRADGSWEQQSATQWTSGFFAGTLWYMYQLTRQPEWRDLAEKWTTGLESNKSITSTHDLGFMIFNSFGHGYLLTGNPHYKEVVLEASRSLVTRYNPRVGAIKSWNTERSADRRANWKYPVIIDNLMNLELLFWSAANGGDPEWKNIAEQHALTAARTQVRADGSTAHVALFDPNTGALENTVTWQGYSDSSAWARGQAWAIHGFTNAYARTGRPELLAAAKKTADYFISHLPPDGIPYWDFRDPDIPNTERDASAAAIAASGLLDLARHTDSRSSARYRTVAQKILRSLARDYTAGPDSAAILEHSVGGRPQNSEVDVGLVYADYYYVEALLRLKGF